MTSTLDLEIQFLEVLKTPRSTQLHKIVTYVSWTDLMTSTLDLEIQFLEVLKTPRSTQLQVKCVLPKY